MLWKLDLMWLLMGIATVGGLSYMLALLMESSLGKEGFGPFGNAFLITAGFFLSILGANYQGINASNLKYAMIIGLSGAFALMLLLMLIRGVWSRF
jgi:hypothetical protein